MTVDADELDVRFTYHPPKDGQPERYGAIRAKALEFARLVETEVPQSREQSLAYTSNVCLVGSLNSSVCIIAPVHTLTPYGARVHAAWLLTMADIIDPEPMHNFDEILAAVRST